MQLGGTPRRVPPPGAASGTEVPAPERGAPLLRHTCPGHSAAPFLTATPDSRPRPCVEGDGDPDVAPAQGVGNAPRPGQRLGGREAGRAGSAAPAGRGLGQPVGLNGAPEPPGTREGVGCPGISLKQQDAGQLTPHTALFKQIRVFLQPLLLPAVCPRPGDVGQMPPGEGQSICNGRRREEGRRCSRVPGPGNAPSE